MQKKSKKIQIAEPITGLEEWKKTKDVFLSGWLTQGSKVREFEKKFAKYHKVKHAIAVSSCTTGLHLVLAASGIGPGDEVIVPSFTWVSTANAVMYCGATPIFADVDPTTNNIDVKSVISKITNKTKAIIVVHLFGLCVNVKEIKKNISKNILIFEDCACAVGASINNKYAGSLAMAGVFSFHPRKIITTGEGGMITTNDSLFAKKINTLRNHGASISEEERHLGLKPHIMPDFKVLGFNYRMTDIQGAVGIIQLSKLKKLISFRQKWAKYYQRKLKVFKWIILPPNDNKVKSCWQSFVVHINDKESPMPRNEIMNYLSINNVSTRPGTHAIHMLDYYKKLYNFKDSDLPGAKSCNDYSIALPLHNKMIKDDFDRIIGLFSSIS